MKFVLVSLVLFVNSFAILAADVSRIAQTAEQVTPILNGQELPDVNLVTVDGKPVNLRELASEKPSVIIFYRGGWCPYCSAQLAGLKDVEQRIVKNGYQIIAISPDSPERLKEQTLETEFQVTLLSDKDFSATAAFGLGFYLPEKTAKRYKDRMGVAFPALDGTSKVALPVPAVYIADTDGLVHFQYVNPNFKVRVQPELLYQATKLLDLAP